MAHRQSPECRSCVQRQLKKTKLCVFFSQGKCHFGSKCDFAHGSHDLVGQPDLTKTSLCEDWLAGRCSIMDGTCRYAHGEEELRITPVYAQAALSRRATNGTALTAKSNLHAAHAGNTKFEKMSHGNSTPEGESELKIICHDNSAFSLEERMSRSAGNSILLPGVKLDHSFHGNCSILINAELKPSPSPKLPFHGVHWAHLVRMQTTYALKVTGHLSL